MTSQLPVSSLVKVDVNLASAPAQAQSLSNLLVLGSSNVINTTERMRIYSTLPSVATDFGTAAPEYLAATRWFGQSPQPGDLLIGRWAQAATSGQLIGGSLSAAQQALAAWNVVTSGGFDVTIDGAAKTPLSLDFSGATNLNGVASIITTALASAGTCVWNANYSRFEITSATTGPGAKASGTITFNGIPAAADTATIGGTAITFVAASPTGNQVLIGSSAAATAANLQAFLIASSDTNLVKNTYSTTGIVTTITFASAGTAGNAITLAKSSTNIAVSGATLSGGAIASSVSFATPPASGLDISGMLAMNASSSGAYVVAASAAESAVSAATLFDSQFGQKFYALVIAGAVSADHLAVAAYVEGTNTKHAYGVTSQEAGCLVATDTSNIAYQLKQLAYRKTVTQYSSSDLYAVVSLLARILTTDYTANNTVITLMYKTEPGIVAETLNTNQMAALLGFNCNVFVAYDNNTAIIEPGVVASGDFIDTIFGADWFAIDIQNSVFNLLYSSPTKIPQTDAGNHIITTAIEAVGAQGVTNGLLAPGVWTQAGFGSLNQGDFLPKGYYVYAPPIALQNPADRAARKSVAFQVAGKLAGAIHTADILVNINR